MLRQLTEMKICREIEEGIKTQKNMKQIKEKRKNANKNANLLCTSEKNSYENSFLKKLKSIKEIPAADA